MKTSLFLHTKESTIPNRVSLLTLTFAIVSLVMISLFACNGPVNPASHEQSTFTAADTSDIRALANTIHTGQIRNIEIFYAPQIAAKRAAASKEVLGMLAPPSSHASVTYEPEWIETSVKRYYSLTLSNCTWPESDALREDTYRVIRNNWITSKNRLSASDKTVLVLDSCTIEATVSGVNIDTLKHLLNQISAGRYTYDTLVSQEIKLQVNAITSIYRNSDNDPSIFRIRSSNSTIFVIQYVTGVPLIKGITMIMY